MWRVWLLSRWNMNPNVKSDSSTNVKSDSSSHHMWSVTPLHMTCEEWFLSTPNVKNDSVLNAKSDSSTHQIWRFTSNVKSVIPLHIKCGECDSSPHQMWRVWFLPTSSVHVKSVTPLHMRATPLHTKCEELLLSKCVEWVLSTPYEKSYYSPHEMWRVTTLRK
jgi:hypothetical protein